MVSPSNKFGLFCGGIAFVCWIGGYTLGGILWGRHDRAALSALRDSLATAQEVPTWMLKDVMRRDTLSFHSGWDAGYQAARHARPVTLYVERNGALHVVRIKP